tara:strand:+ start:1442 stop:1573 length:132 start_codon:yes stop_codon:yes gene_type:complete
MIKKILLISLVFSIFISCGKKGDPVYVDPDKKVQKLYTLNVIT